MADEPKDFDGMSFFMGIMVSALFAIIACASFVNAKVTKCSCCSSIRPKVTTWVCDECTKKVEKANKEEVK